MLENTAGNTLETARSGVSRSIIYRESLASQSQNITLECVTHDRTLCSVLAANVLWSALPRGASVNGGPGVLYRGRQNTAPHPQICPRPKPQNLAGPNGLSRCDPRDLKMGGVAWIIQVGPERNHEGPYKREGDSTTEEEVGGGTREELRAAGSLAMDYEARREQKLEKTKKQIPS